MVPTSPSPQAQLAQVVTALNGKDLNTAQALLAPLLAKMPADPTLLYLQGGIHAERGEHDKAIEAFSASLRAKRAQPQVWQSLGLAQHRLGDPLAAIEALKTALSLAPNFAQAASNLGRIAQHVGDVAEARRAFEKLAAMAPQDPTGPWQLVMLALAEDDFDTAEAQLVEAERRQPGNPQTVRLTARRLAAMGAQADAMAVYRKLVTAASPPDLLQEGAREAFRAGAFDEAMAWIDQARAQAPRNPGLLLDACRMAFALDAEDWFDPVTRAVAAYPDDPAILSMAAHIATLGERGRDILPALSKSIEGGVREPGFLSALGVLEADCGDLDRGLARQRTAVSEGGGLNVWLNHALLALKSGETEEADAVLSKVVRQEPDNQLGLAYRVSVLRARNNIHAGGLFDTERFVERMPIACPPGYDSLGAFNADLAKDLVEIHQTDRQPLDQSLRGGTQIELSRIQHRIQTVGLLAEALKSNVRRYIGDLPRDAEHPFLGRYPEEVMFSGIWSVRLSVGGHHVSHAHPEGWLSSCYYVSLPPSVENHPSHEGWLRLGVAPWQTPSDVEPVDIEPKEGNLVLFPSYFWHGTVPFADTAPRLTVAFDVKPAPR